MKIVLSLNKKERLYDYISMGIDTFVLGCEHSFYVPYQFSLDEIKDIKCQYPHIRIYIAINALYDQHVINQVESFIQELSKLNVEGIIFQDFGVLQIVKENAYHFDMMYSPETLNTNDRTLDILSLHGVTSAFVSRVIPLEEQVYIKEQLHLPLMIQGHGVEYIAASKRRLLTNYQEASQLNFDKEHHDVLKIKAKNSDYAMHIYEDDKGTHIFSESRLYTLDLFHHFEMFDYLYIETLMMNEEEAIEVASLYTDALKSLENGQYDKEVKEFMGLLYRLKTPLDRGFLFDQTVYKLEDVRKMDNEKRESNR